MGRYLNINTTDKALIMSAVNVKLVHGFDPVTLDRKLTNKYLRKIDNAKSRKIEFNLTYAEYKRIMTRKRCAYTGFTLTLHTTGNPVGNDVTLERIDETKGYTLENCIAVSYTANNVKSVFENTGAPLNVNDAIRMFANIDKLKKKMK